MTSTLAPTPSIPQPNGMSTREVSRGDALWCVYAVLGAATLVVVGVIWDISWHMSIGRDTLFTPAHVAIYAGGALAGIACGALVVWRTFVRNPASDATSVRFWRVFRGPLGAWVCIWGTIAMMTSAPFDDWWHQAYGLDVKILSPPHLVLALGIGGIIEGALLMTLAAQNRGAERVSRGSRFSALLAYATGLLLTSVLIVIAEYTDPTMMHASIFYVLVGAIAPLILMPAVRASKLAWPVTAATACYTGIMLVMLWVLPLFPATPKLGPIYQHITHMVPMDFPLLLILPALAVDIVTRRLGARTGDWTVAAIAAIVFVGVLLAVQWPFSVFMVSPKSHNWFFAGDNFPYAMPNTTYAYRGLFRPWDGSAFGRLLGLGLAFGGAIVTSRIGLAVGRWMSRVYR